MKLAPVVRALQAQGRLPFRIIDTGQHYDRGMNGVFFKELGIPEPEVYLEVGSGPHGSQTARILERYEAHLLENRPRSTVVFGDVNSTVGCALAAVKLGVPVAHVEAGLRSFDRTMPEEINRLLTDTIADLLLVTEKSGVENLRREGIAEEKIHLVGNVMIDTLLAQLPAARALNMASRLGLRPKRFGLLTLHRPSNVDSPETLQRLLSLFSDLATQVPLVFPVHPRTRHAAERTGLAGLLTTEGSFRCVPPLSYRENVSLMAGAAVVLTDSGGMQEETSALGIPCITLRENTERPITTEFGTSRLVGNDSLRIRAAFQDAIEGRWPAGEAIPLWDGHAAERVAKALEEWA